MSEEKFGDQPDDHYGGIPIHESLDEVLARLKGTAAEPIAPDDSKFLNSGVTASEGLSPTVQQNAPSFDTSEEAEVQKINPFPYIVNPPPNFDKNYVNACEPEEFWTDEHEIPSGTRRVTGLEAFAIKRGLPTSTFTTRNHKASTINESIPPKRTFKRLTVASLGLLAAGAVVVGAHDIHGKSNSSSLISHKGGSSPALALAPNRTKSETATASSSTEIRTVTSVSKLAVGKAIISAADKENTPIVNEKIKPVTPSQIQKVESINGIKPKAKTTTKTIETSPTPTPVTPVEPAPTPAPVSSPHVKTRRAASKNNGGASVKHTGKSSVKSEKPKTAKKRLTSGGSGL